MNILSSLGFKIFFTLTCKFWVHLCVLRENIEKWRLKRLKSQIVTFLEIKLKKKHTHINKVTVKLAENTSNSNWPFSPHFFFFSSQNPKFIESAIFEENGNFFKKSKSCTEISRLSDSSLVLERKYRELRAEKTEMSKCHVFGN